MSLVTRELLLRKQELKIEKVDLGEGVFVYVKEMTGAARDAFERSMYTIKQNKEGSPEASTKTDHFRAKLAVSTLCNQKGKLLLEPEDYKTLSENMGAKRLELIVEAAQKLNKMTKEDKEETEKNSSGEQAADSNSDLQKN